MRDKDSRDKRNIKLKSNRDFKLASHNKDANLNCYKNLANKNSLQSRNRPTDNRWVEASQNKSQNHDKNCK